MNAGVRSGGASAVCCVSRQAAGTLGLKDALNPALRVSSHLGGWFQPVEAS